MRRWVYGLVAAGIGIAQSAVAGEVCKMTQLKNPALTLSEIYSIADGHAKAWQKDAVPAQIANTSLGPLQPNGSSVAWNLQFYSAQAKAHMAVTTFRGSLSCSAEAGSFGRIPDLKLDFFRDGAKLYSLAQQHGGALLKQGYFVMIATAAAPSDRHATWYVNFSNAQSKSGGLSVIVNANTGAVEKVLKD
jgi:hypothetical protein